MNKLKLIGAWAVLPFALAFFLAAWLCDGPEEHTEDY